MRLITFLALVVVVAGLDGAVRPVQAQSLADVARAEEERRKDVKVPSKVITDKDLKAVPGSTPGVVSSAPSTEAAKDATATLAQDDKEKEKDKAKSQAYWAGRKKELQEKFEQDQRFADALQSRINALTADFTARDDPAQRRLIEIDRQKALTDLSRLQKNVEAGKKALADLDEEARKAGVPPGWLR